NSSNCQNVFGSNYSDSSTMANSQTTTHQSTTTPDSPVSNSLVKPTEINTENLVTPDEMAVVGISNHRNLCLNCDTGSFNAILLRLCVFLALPASLVAISTVVWICRQILG
ncbi:unnamed protein product, partial [Heterobilharzia americana]